METGIKIGHDKQAIDNISDLIRYIIDAPTGECVKLAAFKAMKETLSISHMSISNCTVDGSTPTYNYYSDDETKEGN